MKLYTLDNQFIKRTVIFPNNFTGIVINAMGTKQWYFNDRLHRLDGPAIEGFSGGKEWFIYGKQVTEEQHTLLVDIMKLKGLL